MISFKLSCERDHVFDAWFRNGDDFESQARRGLIDCPVCGSNDVEKSLMAPAVSTRRGDRDLVVAQSPDQKKIMAKMVELARKIRKNADDVGDRFPEEARKIHYGETDPRGIFGKASLEEAASLAEEGVDFMPLPPLPEDKN